MAEHRYLADWLFFADHGVFRTGDDEEIMNKATCLSLLSNAVLVWNTVKTFEIVSPLRTRRETVRDKDLARTSPLVEPDNSGEQNENGTAPRNGDGPDVLTANAKLRRNGETSSPRRSQSEPWIRRARFLSYQEVTAIAAC